MKISKTIAFIHQPDSSSTVGDFSPVTSVFSHYQFGNTLSPFLLLDHLGPGHLLATRLRKGVFQHPHRGFETVTLVYQGEIEHCDSTGEMGIIRAGDVQWMTAGSGVLHEEVFSESFSKVGGPFEFIQLWVNLPAKHKMTAARYQSLVRQVIPLVSDHHQATVRVIAGTYSEQVGPAQTYTPMHVLDVHMQAGATLTLPAADQTTALIYLRSGRVKIQGSESQIESYQLGVMSNQGENVEVLAVEDSAFLYLSGQPLNEPVYGRGYFVMNNFAEVMQAYEDLKNNTFLQH